MRVALFTSMVVNALQRACSTVRSTSSALYGHCHLCFSLVIYEVGIRGLIYPETVFGGRLLRGNKLREPMDQLHEAIWQIIDT